MQEHEFETHGPVDLYVEKVLAWHHTYAGDAPPAV